MANEWWVLCTVDKSCTEDWPTELVKTTGQKFPGCPPEPAAKEEEKKEEKKEGIMVEKKVIEIQPFFLTPQPAEDCKFDWDYKFHGMNWKCNCNEGLQQSPINIPPHDGLEYVKKPIKFEYNYLESNEIEAV